MRPAVLLGLGLALALSGCGPSQPAADPSVSSGSPTSSVPSTLTVSSNAFEDGGQIPATYTCAGPGQVPTLSWTGDLRGATALALVVEDPDAPGATFVHRVVVDLPVTASSLGADPPAGAHQAANSAGRAGWTPPCPPSGTHHYRFTVYGLSSPTGLPDGAPADDALAAINSRAVVQGRLVGLVSH